MRQELDARRQTAAADPVQMEVAAEAPSTSSTTARQLGQHLGFDQASAALQPGSDLFTPAHGMPAVTSGSPVQMNRHGGGRPGIHSNPGQAMLNMAAETNPLIIGGDLPNSTVRPKPRRGKRGKKKRIIKPKERQVSLKSLGRAYDRHKAQLVVEATRALRAELVSEMSAALGAEHIPSYRRGGAAGKARAFRARVKAEARLEAQRIAAETFAVAGAAGDDLIIVEQNQHEAREAVGDTKGAAGAAIRAIAAQGVGDVLDGKSAAFAEQGKGAYIAHPEQGADEANRLDRARTVMHGSVKGSISSIREEVAQWRDTVLESKKDGGDPAERDAWDKNVKEKLKEKVGGAADAAALNTAASVACLAANPDWLKGAVDAGEASIKTKTIAYLEPKLGKGGLSHRRNRHAVGAFRKKMKEAAREQAFDDVDTEVGSATGALAQKGAATKAYVGLDAKKHAYTKAKASVDTALGSLAVDGAQTAMGLAKTHIHLEQAARAAALEALRGNTIPSEAVAVKGAKAGVAKAVKAEATLAQLHARAWKNTLIGKANTQTSRGKGGAREVRGKDAAGEVEFKKYEQLGLLTTDAIKEGGGPRGQTALDEGASDRGLVAAQGLVKKQTTVDEVGQKSVKASLAANTAEQGMGLIGRICDMTVPNRGDACKLEVEIKIPVGQPGVFVLLRVVGEAQRGVTDRRDEDGDSDTSSLAFQCEIAFGGGASVMGVELNGAVGFFVRSQAMDTHKAMNAIAYAGYRGACAVKRAGDALGNWWAGARPLGGTWRGAGRAAKAARAHSQVDDGHGGQEATSATREAEMWAAMLEEQVFMKNAGGALVVDEDAFADLGGSATAKAKLKTVVGEGEASVRAELFKHYDGAHIAASLNALALVNPAVGLGKAGGTNAAAKDRRAKAAGEWQGQFVAEVKGKFLIAGNTVEFGGQLTIGSDGSPELTIHSMLICDTAGSPSEFDRIAAGIISSSLSLAQTLAGAYKSRKKDGKTRGYHAVGSAVDVGNDLEGLINAGMGNKLGQRLADNYKVGTSKADQNTYTDPSKVEKDKAGASSEFGLKFAFTGSSQGAFVELSQVKVRKLAVGAVGFQVGGVGVEGSIERSKRLAKFGRHRRDAAGGGTEWGEYHAEGLGFGGKRS